MVGRSTPLQQQKQLKEKKNSIKESLEIQEQVQGVQVELAAVGMVMEDYLQVVHRRHHHQSFPIQKQVPKKQSMHGTPYYQIMKTLQDVTIVIPLYVVQQTTRAT